MDTTLQRTGARSLAIEPVGIGTALEACRPGHDGMRVLCHGAGMDPTAGAAYQLVTPEGLAVGIGTVTRGPGPRECSLAVAAMLEHDQEPALRDLLVALGLAARLRGCDRVVTCVDVERFDPYPVFRAAGWRLVSSLRVGGTAEVVLALD
jgi:hypothetical protein